jgi:hypothetical protein
MAVTFTFDVISKAASPTPSGIAPAIMRSIKKSILDSRGTDYSKSKGSIVKSKLLTSAGVITDVLAESNGTVREVKEIRDLYSTSDSPYVEELVEGVSIKWSMNFNSEKVLISDIITISEMGTINSGAWLSDLQTITAHDYSGGLTSFTTPSLTDSTAMNVLRDVDFVEAVQATVLTLNSVAKVSAHITTFNALVDAGAFPADIKKVNAESTADRFWNTLL